VDSYFTSAKFLPVPLSASGRGDAQDRPCAIESEILRDENLVFRIQLGDQEALAELFRSYARPIRNIGIKILRDKAEADDLVQEVFLYLHRKSQLFDSSKGSARSWIFQVAYTQALLRRRQLGCKGLYGPNAAKQVESDKRIAGADYDSSLEGAFGRNGWRRVLESLTEDQRETLKLHFFEGYTFDEIAEKLGQSYANVRHHHYRGLEKLRKHIAKSELKGR